MANDKESTQLSERSSLLLKHLIDKYIEDGAPVGSRTLSTKLNGQLSAATIRNVMADLEDKGLICSPHTSAGRVPTAKGYRFFVDGLLSVQPLKKSMIQKLADDFSVTSNNEGIIKSASSILSSFTQLAGVVTVPKTEQVVLRQIEFLPLNENRVLAILVVNDSEVQNRIIEVHEKVSRDELTAAANYINAHYQGKPLGLLREEMLGELQQAKSTVDKVMSSAMSMAEKVFDQDKDSGDFILRGETNLMSYHDLSDVDELKKLFEVFQQKRDMLYVLDQCIQGEGIQIYIGEESGYAELNHCSLVTAPYKHGEETVGVLGVIGPTRMNYDKVVSIVDITSKLVSAALNSK